MSRRDLTYNYISKRRLDELEARITPSWLGRITRQTGSLSISLPGLPGGGWSRHDPVETEFRRQLGVLSKVEQDLRRHNEIGSVQSEAPYMEQELLMGYSLWTFEDTSDETSRTAASWYGEDLEAGYQVVLLGNPQYLSGVPEGAIRGIPLGTAIGSDPAAARAIVAVRRHIEQLAARASSEQSLPGISPLDLEDQDLASNFSNLVSSIWGSMNTLVYEGRLPETTFATRHFLAHRVSSSRAGSTYFGTPVYVATVERSRPG